MMAGNPFINSIAKQNKQGDPRFGRFGAGGSSSQGQYQAQPNYSSEPQQYGQQTYGYGQPQQANYDQYQQAQYDPYAQPGYAPVAEGDRLTMNDVIMKTGLNLALVVLGAAVSWYLPYLMFVGLIAGLILGIVNAVKRKVSPALVMLYSVSEGLLLGGISGLLNKSYPGIAIQALLASVIVAGLTLALFANGKIRATPKMTKIFMIGMFAYLIYGIVSWLGAGLFGSPLGSLSIGGIPLGLIVGLFTVAMATYSLLLDFTNTAEAVEAGLPERESWRLAFGLTASLVWLYIEILRILMYINEMVNRD
jgi:protein of hypothetical function DUF1112